MRGLLLALVFPLSSISLFGQQLPIFSIYHENGFILNPAMAGAEDHGIISATYRDQWNKVEKAPNTASLSYRVPVFRTNNGLGGMVTNDQTGPTAFTGITFAYAYHISFKKVNAFRWAKFLRKSKLSLGLSASLYQYRLNASELVLETPQDQAVAGTNEFKFLPNAGVGLYFYYDYFYLGFSAPQLIPLNVKYNGDAGISTIKRVNHFYTVVGGSIPFGRRFVAQGLFGGTRKYTHKFYLEPMFWFKYVKGAPYQMDSYLRFKVRNYAWVGVGYRSSNTMIFDAGLLIANQVQIGYAYDLPISDVRPYIGNTHEVILAYHFKSKKSKSFGVR